MNSVYLCIDLKTFYASVECVQRGLDPFAAPLVVADPSRGKGAICLAVSPKMKALGVRNRCRIFEIPASIAYITALPRMELYMRTAADIYGIYLRYVAPGDIHVYSIDEAFLDITPYLRLYGLSARELARRIMADVWQTTGITATAGIGTNLYLAKVALDLIAKHEPEGIGELDEASYRQQLWHHQPLSDFARAAAPRPGLPVMASLICRRWLAAPSSCSSMNSVSAENICMIMPMASNRCVSRTSRPIVRLCARSHPTRSCFMIMILRMRGW